MGAQKACGLFDRFRCSAAALDGGGRPGVGPTFAAPIRQILAALT
jgi:hypothetical protein